MENKTLRDEFAIAAIQGCLAGQYFVPDDTQLISKAYEIADAAMKLREDVLS